MAKTNKSPNFRIDKVGLKKVGKGLLIGIAGVVVTALESAIFHVDFGEYNGIAIAVNAMIVNLARKFIISYN